MTENLGFAHFLEQIDTVGMCVILVLTLMSVATWFVVIVRSWAVWLSYSTGNDFLGRFRASGSLVSAQHVIATETPRDPYARLASSAWAACAQRQQPQGGALIKPGPEDVFLTAALDQTLATELARMEEGLAILSSVASTAPFIGLFGTVWGIYHALLAIGTSGQTSLDQLAGAVGEALIMTGCGLIVAIPAVLGYNALTYWNGKLMGSLQAFGHELAVLLSTGTLTCSGAVSPAKRMPQAVPAE